MFTAYGDGYVAVNHEKHAKNLIVLPESIIFEWSTATPATLAEGDMQKLLELGSEIILLGTGRHQRFQHLQVAHAVQVGEDLPADGVPGRVPRRPERLPGPAIPLERQCDPP